MHLNKSFIVLLLMLACGGVQAQYKYLMDSLLIYKYEDSGWVIASSTIYTHLEKDSLLDAHGYSIDSSGNRYESTHTKYHYDGLHPMWLNLTYRYKNSQDTNWINLGYSERVFGTHGLSTEAFYDWNDTGQVWEISSKDSLFYDGNGQLQSRITYYLKSDTLSPSILLRYIYGAANHLDTLVRYSYVSYQWKQMRRTEFHPDGNGFDTLQLEVNYNTLNGNITSRTRYRNILNQAGDQLTREYSFYDQATGGWKITNRWVQELDPDIPIEQVQIAEEIQNIFHFQQAPISGENWIIQNGVLTKFRRYEYFKHQVIPNAVKSHLKQDLNVYPNPFTHTLTVPGSDFPLAESVHIYTLQGVKVSQHMLDATGQIALNGLADGIYFLQVLDKEGRVLGTGKVVKR